MTAGPFARWVCTCPESPDRTEHLGGVSWYDTKPPPRRHECAAQTRGWHAGGYWERCACGARRAASQAPAMGPWGERNCRRQRWWRR